MKQATNQSAPLTTKKHLQLMGACHEAINWVDGRDTVKKEATDVANHMLVAEHLTA